MFGKAKIQYEQPRALFLNDPDPTGERLVDRTLALVEPLLGVPVAIIDLEELAGIGIGDGHKELTQAVIEGVAFALKDSHEALKATGTELKSLLGIGGGSNSDYWVELIATLLDVAVDLPVAGDFGAALGAARLACRGRSSGR